MLVIKESLYETVDGINSSGIRQYDEEWYTRFDENKAQDFDFYKPAYTWITSKMKERIRCTPDGESMTQVAARVYPLIEELKERYTGKNVLLICHVDVCRVLKTYFQDMTNDEFFNYSLENARFEKYSV